jgi:uncharacterized protein
MDMNPVRLSDKKLFDEFFGKVPEPLADTTFAMRYIWSKPLKHTWTIINGNLCVFGFLKDKYLVWGPPVGGKNLQGTLNSCFEIVNDMNKKEGITAKPSVIYIPQSLKETYSAAKSNLGCTLNYWTQDYVYPTLDLIELKGAKFDSKRHKANQFAKSYDFKIEEFDGKAHIEGCLKILDIWKSEKDEIVTEYSRYELDAEAKVAAELIKNASQLGARGIVLKVEGKIVGVSLGEPLSSSIISNIIEKTSPALNGASEFIFREFSRFWSAYKFLNAQDDFGVDYLKRVKLSYHPTRLVESYCLEKK